MAADQDTEILRDMDDDFQGEGVLPPLTYYGGKQRLCREIVQALLQSPNWSETVHYVEPFFGGGAVFFAKPPNKLETVNDLNDNLVTFYRVVKHPPAFAKMKALVEGTLYSRKEFDRTTRIIKGEEKADPILRAWAVFSHLAMSFSSGWGNGFGYSVKAGSSMPLRFDDKKRKLTDELCQRLHNVTIECGDAVQVIKSRDSEATLFYLDPPYAGTQCNYNGLDFGDANLSRLLRTLASVKGRFVLSGFPHYLIEKMCRERSWQLVSKRCSYSLQTVDPEKKEGKVEILASNYPFSLEGWQTDIAFSDPIPF